MLNTLFKRYLYEISDYDVCLRLIETAISATEEKDSLRYAHLCNTAASCYYELNKMAECRKHFEIVLRIREEQLPEDHIDVRINFCQSPLAGYWLTINVFSDRRVTITWEM